MPDETGSISSGGSSAAHDESAVVAEPSATRIVEPEAMTPEQLDEARRYGRTQLACQLADKGIDLVYLGVMAFFVALPLDAWLAGYLASDWLRLIAIFAITMGLHECVSLPLSFYAGHLLERRYQLSNQTARRWLGRHYKRFALAAAFGLAMFCALYAMIWWTHGWWWIIAAAGFFLVSIVLGQLAPVVILPLFYKIDKLNEPELAERMTRLAEGTGLSIEGVYRMQMSDETVKANAMLAGLGRTRRVLMGDTLLESFSPDEIEVIFAHEIGHHVFGHLRKMIASGVIYVAAGFWICDRLLAEWVAAHQPGAFSYATFPVYALPMLMFVLTVFSMAVEPLQNVISRRYERQCDRYALKRTGMTEAYRSAFRKLARLNKDDPDPNPLEVALFHSHPPIAERLALADEPSG